MSRTIVASGAVALLLAAGAGGAASSAGQGRIVFSSFLPEYPLPDNFQVDRTFVDASQLVILRLGGSAPRTIRGGYALREPAWSPNSTTIYIGG